MTFQVSYMVMCGPRRSRLKNCSLISITILKCIERRLLLLIGSLRFIRKIIGFQIATKRKCTNMAIYSWNFSHKHLLKLNTYRRGQANCKFQFSLLLVKNPQYLPNLWYNQSLNVWDKLHRNCGFFFTGIESWNLQLAWPGL